MNDDEWIVQMRALIKARLCAHLAQLSVREMASLDRIEALVRVLLAALATAAFEAWSEVLTKLVLDIAVTCPGCDHARKCKLRASDPIRARVLGLTIEIAKPYLECGHRECEAPGVSISALLTGLTTGTASSELRLRAGYAGSQHSYGKASRDLEVHYGETVERTAVRRMALEVEERAKDFAERSRKKALAQVEQEERRPGVPVLMLQGDGGVIRTGTLVPCVRGDPGFGKLTAKRQKKPRRKRPVQFREMILFDVRKPGESEASALDIMVPIHAEKGERERRMLALAVRNGLGDDTEVVGLGDMGSALPAAFAEAFVGHPKSRWYGDWHHVCDYVIKAGDVLRGLDVELWRKRTRDALWERNERERDRLLRRAQKHRVDKLPAHMEKCPVAALKTYLINNWDHLRSAELKARGLEYVSARAEAQVRVRIHGRYAVPGSWLSENLEGKATLRAIIDEGRWSEFRADYLQRAAQTFEERLAARLAAALADGRLSRDQIAALGARAPDQTTARKAA